MKKERAESEEGKKGNEKWVLRCGYKDETRKGDEKKKNTVKLGKWLSGDLKGVEILEKRIVREETC